MKKILKFLRNLLWTVLILAMIAIASLEALIYFEVIEMPSLEEIKEWLDVKELINKITDVISEKERVKIKQRQAEGIANAKAKGKHLGRPRVEYPGNFKEVYDKWKAKEITGVKAMELMNLKKNSFYNLIKKYEKEKKSI